jgi:hypothetical protein
MSLPQGAKRGVRQRKPPIRANSRLNSTRWCLARHTALQLLPRPVVVGADVIRGVGIVSGVLVEAVGGHGTIPSAAVDLFNYLESLEQSVPKLVVVPIMPDSTCHDPGCNPQALSQTTDFSMRLHAYEVLTVRTWNQ